MVLDQLVVRELELGIKRVILRNNEKKLKNEVSPENKGVYIVRYQVLSIIMLLAV